MHLPCLWGSSSWHAVLVTCWDLLIPLHCKAIHSFVWILSVIWFAPGFFLRAAPSPWYFGPAEADRILKMLWNFGWTQGRRVAGFQKKCVVLSIFETTLNGKKWNKIKCQWPACWVSDSIFCPRFIYLCPLGSQAGLHPQPPMLRERRWL